jgi:trypsin
VRGWGAVSSGSSSLPSQLHAVKVVIVSREQCNVAYSGYGGITDRMVCATGGDVCQGDSGGPLAVNGILVGVVSWVGGCAEASYPGVYSSIASLRDFITEQTGVN